MSTRLPLLLAMLVSGASAQTLVKDINGTPPAGAETTGSEPNGYVVAGSDLYFAATTPARGRELWVTDGTAAGTRLCRDVHPGEGSGGAYAITPAPGGGVLFRAIAPGLGDELWRSDGTPAGTTLVKDVRPGEEGSGLGPMVAMGGLVYFLADDGVHGVELWRTDGTPSGTTMVGESVAGPGPTAAAADLVRLGAADLVWGARDTSAALDWTLFRSDGTAAGTGPIAALGNPVAPVGPAEMTPVGSRVVFRFREAATGEEPWVTDGTAAGTLRLADLWTGVSSSFPGDFTAVGGLCYFEASMSGVGRELIVTDGTVAGTQLVADIRPGSASSSPDPLGAVGSTLLFSAETAVSGRELWRTDGTAAGTWMVREIVAGSAGSFPPLSDAGGATLGGALYFSAETPSLGAEVWRSDGTAAGTVPVADVDVGTSSSNPWAWVTYGGAVCFTASDGAHGREPWRTDGTSGGTSLIADVATPPASSSDPVLIGRVGDRAVFLADDGTVGRELWVTDGTAAGTQLLLDLVTGPDGLEEGPFVQMDGRIFVALDTPTYGREPWVTDGTALGTRLLADVRAGVQDGLIGPHAAALGDEVYFSGLHPSVGMEVFVTDGTPAGTALAVDVTPGPAGSMADQYVAWNGRLLFRALGPTNFSALFASDGTPAGTTPIGPNTPPELVSVHGTPQVAEFGGRLYFPGYDNATGLGWEAWRTDGTVAGTTMLADLVPGSGSSGAGDFVVVGGKLLFRARDGATASPYQLFASDGTASGTARLKTVALAGAGIEPGIARLDEARAVFLVHEGGDRRVWATDGTAAGTFPVTPALAIEKFAYDRVFEKVGSAPVALFRVDDPAYGDELWVTDGTIAGTGMAADVAPDGLDAAPGSLLRLGSKVVFAADDGVHGRELHALDLALYGDHAVEVYGAACAGTGGVEPAISSVGEPVFASPFAVTLEDALPNAAAGILLGDGRLALSAFGCALLVQPAWFLPAATDAAGGASLDVPVTTALIGVRLNFQWAVADPGGAALGTWSASDGLEVVFGP